VRAFYRETPLQTAARLRAIDWLRGAAVLVMVQCHALCLLDVRHQREPGFATLAWLDGWVAPSFLFAAGASLGLVLVRAAAAGALRERAAQSLRRAAEVLAVSAAMTWLWFPIFTEPGWLLRVDILSCIGLSLLGAWVPGVLLARRPRALAWTALLGAGAALGLAPLVESVRGPWAAVLTNATGSVFPPVPWAGHVLLGLSLGAGAGAADFGRHLRFVLSGALWVWLLARVLGPLYPPHGPYTEPAAHAERFVEVVLLVWLLWWVERRATGAPGPLRRGVELLGRRSLLAYCAHEVLLYVPVLGFCFRDRFGTEGSWAAYAAEASALLALTIGLCLAADGLQALASWAWRQARARASLARGLPRLSD
jgi:uncharacterized membrane protein